MKEIPNCFIKTYTDTPEKVIIMSDNLNVLWINRNLQNILDSALPAQKEIQELYFDELLRYYLHEDEFIIHEIINGIKKFSSNKQSCFTYEFPLYNDTESLWLMLTACAAEDADSGSKHIIAKIYDITKLYKERKISKRKEDNEIVKQIIVESMHTWRQPLNSISLFTQDLREQFDDDTLTKYYMNFSTRQIFNEIRRLSESIDEMAVFYSNETDEDIINVAESMFSNVQQIDGLLSETNTFISLNCHALGDLPSENFIDITDNFRIRCGTGTKKCFHGCNKGNIVIYGDKHQYDYIIRSIMTIGTKQDTAKKEIEFEHVICDDTLKIIIHYKNLVSPDVEKLALLKKMFKNNYKGNISYQQADKGVDIIISITEFNAKNPL